MPTRAGSDVVPVRKETKRRLEALRGEGSYDSAIQALLAQASAPPAVALDRGLAPDEQLALADLAARRWALAIKRGVLREIGPRLIVYNTGKRERRRFDVRVA